MQIGFPTDVKHVAHIGCDGPSAATPSNPAWMNEFPSAPSSSSHGQDGRREVVSSAKSSSQDSYTSDPPLTDPPNSKPHRRSRRHASSSESPGTALPTGSESPARSSRHSRRNQSVGSASGSEPASSEGSRRGGSRRSSKSSSSTDTNGSEPANGFESSARDLPSIPKQSRRGKTKVGSEDKSTRSSTRSKNSSFSDADPDPKDGSTRHVQTLETVTEGGI